MSELRRTIRELGKQLNREPDHQVLDQMNNLSIHEAPTTHGNLGVFPATNTTVITASTPVSYLGAPPIPSTIGPTNVPVPGTPNLNMWPPNGQNYHHAFLTPSGVVSHYTTRPSMQNAPIFTSVYQPGTMATSASNGPNLPNTTFVQETSRPSFVPGSPYGNGNVSVYEALTAAQLTARKAMKTDLPKFEGEPETWPAFISFYEETTAACGFTKQENLVRLMNSLTGKARIQVQGLLTVPNNVPYLIERLRALFGRPDQIIMSQLEKVRKLPAPSLERMNTDRLRRGRS